MKNGNRILIGLIGISTFLTILLASCNNLSDNIIQQVEDSEDSITIGDEIIYGDTFSLKDLYTSQARAADITENELIDMVYFSVCPTTVDGVLAVNSALGHLNPTEMNREIMQACDAETIIFNDAISVEDTENIPKEDLVNLGVKYYYIETREKANSLKDALEGFEVIEEFSMPDEEKCEEDDRSASRGLFTKYSISGDITYKIDGKKVPAYGVTMKRGSKSSTTNAEGRFSLGSSRNIYGLCWLWAHYENKACKLSNMFNITASTLVKVAFPSKLSNVSLSASSNYAKAKMAICGELLSRYDDESKRHYGIPKARVWTTQLFNGTASAPSFHVNKGMALPDVLVTGCNSYNEKRMRILHHEYTHFLHNAYVGNKNDFWTNVIESELKTSIRSIINDIFKLGKNVSYYDFSNKYVCFTENLAEWYSFVGLSRGMYGKIANKEKTGLDLGDPSYTNTPVFCYLVREKIATADEIMNIVDSYNVITFQEFYNALVKKYPNKKNKINSAFSKDYYKSYGNPITFQ